MNTTVKIPTWFWVVSGIALLWNLVGVAAFFGDAFMTADQLANLPTEERELYERFPMWSKIAYAISVFGGAIGSLLLILKKKSAKPVLIISLIAIIIQMTHSLFIADSIGVYGTQAIIFPIIVISIAVFLVWLANHAIKKGWLR